MTIEADIWRNISRLKPMLRKQTLFTKQYYRGQLWYVLSDSISGDNFRCPEEVYQFLMLLDGETSIQQAYEFAKQMNQHQPPDQADILSVIATLQNKDLLEGDIPQSASELYQRFEAFQQKTKFQRWSRPLSIKWSLWDPDTFLGQFTPYTHLIFTRVFLFLLILVAVCGVFIAASNWSQLVEHFSSRFMDASNLLFIWLLYPCIKFLHEMGHALSTKYWGGEVHDMGVLFIVFMPIPYVDASSSHQFPKKHHRMLVAAAGILVELLLASLALLIWVYTDEGLARDLAFNIAVIAGLSSLLVNGNPLLRFDGYYVLSDAIEIPNLSSRSTQYLGHLCQRFMLGLDDLPSPVKAKGERAWFVFYGIAAGIYRLFISFTIAFFVASHYLIIGVLLAIWYFIQQILLPVFNALKSLAKAARDYHKQARLMLVSSVLLILSYTVLFVVPLKDSFQIEGVIALPDDAIIRAKADGFLMKVAKAQGDEVNIGDTLFDFENDELIAKFELQKARLKELEAREDEVFSYDQIERQILKEEIRQAEAALQDAKQKVTNLHLVSETAGFFSVPNAGDMPHRFYRKGDVLAYVINYADLSIHAVLPQEQMQTLFADKGVSEPKLEVKLHSVPDKTLTATLGRNIPQAGFQLPVAELGTSGGGSIMVDSRDASGLTALEAIYKIEIQLDHYQEDFLAAKVEIKIQHSSILLSDYLYGVLRRGLIDLADY